MNIQDMLHQIDLAHQRANDALQKKDLQSYLNLFCSNLEYKQANGKSIDKTQLSKDIRKYFTQLTVFRNGFTRLSYSAGDGTFTEKLMQTSIVGIKVFFLFTKRWNLNREAEYVWELVDGSWFISRVKVLTESVG